jgi:hypothetical protein
MAITFFIAFVVTEQDHSKASVAQDDDEDQDEIKESDMSFMMTVSILKDTLMNKHF